jgi:hypothetical protein
MASRTTGLPLGHDIPQADRYIQGIGDRFGKGDVEWRMNRKT